MKNNAHATLHTGEQDAALTLWAGAAIMLALALPTLAAQAMDTRTLIGVSVWDKPLKFEISIAVHSITLALIVSRMTPQARASGLVRGAALVNVLAGIGEIAYILYQAGRGRASHFNFETPFEIVMYGLMGAGATAMVIATLVLGLKARKSLAPELGAGLKLAIVLGLTLGATLTLITAGLLSSGTLAPFGHWVGGVRSDENGLPFFGWSTTGGDLRVPHFFATHLMQALPLLGLAADRLAGRYSPSIVATGAVVGVGVVVATFAQAMMGMPFLALK